MKDLTLCYQNVRGLRTKSDELYASLVGCPYGVIALSETWLSSDHASSFFIPEEYIVYRGDREYNVDCTRGGGVLLAVHKQLVSYRRFDLETFPECVWIEVCVPGELNFLISCCYFAPTVSHHILDAYLESVMSKIDITKYHILIVGDFNAGGFNWEEKSFNPNCPFYSKLKMQSILKFIDYMNLDQLNQGIPGQNTLDLILSNYDQLVVGHTQSALVKEDRYHPTLEITIRGNNWLKNHENTKSFYFPTGDYKSLYLQIQEHNWSGVLLNTTIDAAAESFNCAILKAMRDNIPLRKSRVPRYPKWFSRRLITLLKLKRNAHRKFKKTGENADYVLFSGLRKDVREELDLCKKAYAQSVESDLSSKPTNFWKYIKKFRKSSESVPAVSVDGSVLTNPRELCTRFGQYFSSVFQDLDCNCLDVSQSSDDDRSLHVFGKPLVTVSSVQSAINELKVRSSSGVDGIPSFIIKGVSGIVSPILASLFNWSLAVGSFPYLWKIAAVTPIPKKGPSSLVNFRPISVVGVVAKIFEKIMFKYLYGKVYHLISPHQHGFLSGRSTVTNLASFLEVAGPAVESCGQVDVVYLDFQKAFDKLPHHLFLKKLPNFGFSAELIKWVKSYIQQRTFRVRFGGEVSECFAAKSGVPQGSNLGPLFFLLFINDITSVLNCSVQLFADDIKISLKISGIEDHLCLQRCIDAVAKWADDNLMPLNHSKTVVVTFTRKTNPSYFRYVIDGSSIERKHLVSDLGVIMDSKLLFSQQVSSIVSKARRNLGLVKWVGRHFKTIESCLTLYRSLVRSHLEYASVIWNRKRGYSDDAVEGVQRKFLSWMLFKFPDLHNVTNVREELGLFSLSARRTLFDLIFFHKALQGCSGLNIEVGIRAPQYAFRSRTHFVARYNGVCDPLARCVSVANQFSDRLDFFLDNKRLLEAAKVEFSK